MCYLVTTTWLEYCRGTLGHAVHRLVKVPLADSSTPQPVLSETQARKMKEEGIFYRLHGSNDPSSAKWDYSQGSMQATTGCSHPPAPENSGLLEDGESWGHSHAEKWSYAWNVLYCLKTLTFPECQDSWLHSWFSRMMSSVLPPQINRGTIIMVTKKCSPGEQEPLIWASWRWRWKQDCVQEITHF